MIEWPKAAMGTYQGKHSLTGRLITTSSAQSQGRIVFAMSKQGTALRARSRHDAHEIAREIAQPLSTRPGKSRSPATTTRSNRVFELSPRVRSSKIVIRNPLRRLQCEHRNRNCRSKTSVSDANRYRCCKKPGWYSTLRSHVQRTTITSCTRHSRAGSPSSQYLRTRLHLLLNNIAPGR